MTSETPYRTTYEAQDRYWATIGLGFYKGNLTRIQAYELAAALNTADMLGRTGVTECASTNARKVSTND